MNPNVEEAVEEVRQEVRALVTLFAKAELTNDASAVVLIIRAREIANRLQSIQIKNGD